jgi:hypothetical protein
MPSGYLQLIIGTHSTYENGDIISAANHLTIRQSASSRICFERGRNRQFAGLNGSEFLPHAHLLKDWYEACCEFRLERLNRNQCKQVRLSDMAEIMITTGVPHTDLKGKPDRQMNVDLYFKRRLTSFRKQNAQGKAMFSDDGDELKVVMYGGRTVVNAKAMDAVWAAITNKTGRLESNETTYVKEPPFGSYQKRRIVIRVDDFTNEEAGILTSPLEDLTDPDNPIIVKRRISWVDWEAGLGLSAKEITDSRDDQKNPDLRSDEKIRSTIVNTKTV